MTWTSWVKIVLGMLVIFAVGMVIRSGVREGKRTITNIADGSGPITLPLMGAAFKMDDMRLGAMQKLRIERSAPKVVSGLYLTVRLDDSVPLSRFDECRLTVDNPNDIDENTTFLCASAEDSTDKEMVEFGRVTLQPSGREVALLVPKAFRDEIQKNGHHEIQEISDNADSSDDNVDVNAGPGGLHVKVNGKDVVSMTADSTGVVVKDEHGKKVVDVKIDAGKPAKASAPAKANGRAPVPPAKPATP